MNKSKLKRFMCVDIATGPDYSVLWEYNTVTKEIRIIEASVISPQKYRRFEYNPITKESRIIEPRPPLGKRRVIHD